MQFWQKSLMARLVIYFLFLSGTIVILVGSIALIQAREALKDSVFNRLNAVATLKSNELNSWVQDQLRDVLFLAQLPIIQNEGTTLLQTAPSAPKYKATKVKLTSEIANLLANRPGLQEISLLNLQGKVVFSSDPKHVGLSLAKENYFLRGSKLLFPASSFVQNVYISAETNRPAMTIIAPFFDKHGKRIGLLVAHLYLERMNRIILDRTGLGESGETYLVDTEHQFVSEARFRKQIFQLPQGIHTEGVELALKHQNGSGLYVNYESVPVIGVYRWINEREMALLAEISQAEAFAPAHQLVQVILLIGLISVSLLAIGVYFLARQIAHPILVITHAALQVAAGNLNNLVPVLTKDEVGVLAQVFNQMTLQLQTLYLGLEESEKKYRTIFEETRDTIFVSTPEGRILDVNSAGLQLFGYTVEDLPKLNAENLFLDPSDRLRFKRALEEHGSIRDLELRYKRPDNIILDCLMTATVRHDDDGKVLFQGIIRDITEQKQILRERERLSVIDHELNLARNIQQSLLLNPKPDWQNLDVVCYNQPAREMSGDFYAYYVFNQNLDHAKQNSTVSSLPQSRYAIAVGDISGKGVPAALLMGISLALFQSSIIHGFTPGPLLAHLNRTILPYTQTTRNNCALCLVEILLSPTTQRADFRIANAGCVAPFLKRANGTVEMLDIGGLPLGTLLANEMNYGELTLDFRPGDILILTSDGLVEAQNEAQNLFGFERLEATIAAAPTTTAQATLDYLKLALATFVDHAEPHDDVTIVVIQMPLCSA